MKSEITEKESIFTRLRKAILVVISIIKSKAVPPVPESVVSPMIRNTMEFSDNIYHLRSPVEVYLTPERLKFYKELVDLLPASNITYRGKTIADVGCGSGDLLMTVQQLEPDCSLYGFDWCPEAVKWAKERTHSINFQVSDAHDNFGTYDIIFCTETLEHILDAHNVLENFLGRCREVVVLSVPNGRVDTYEGHLNFWSPESWHHFISEFDDKCETGLLTQLVGGHRGQYAILHGCLHTEK